MLIGGKRGPRAKVAHGHARRGRKTSIYELWRDLRKRYPGQVCRRWQSFETFVRDLGARPPGWVLARLNPRRVWGPSNVGWAIPSNRGSRNRQAKLTEAEVEEIRTLCASGVPQMSVAERYGVSRTQVGRIHREESWQG
jgi:hypothetical protein